MSPDVRQTLETCNRRAISLGQYRKSSPPRLPAVRTSAKRARASHGRKSIASVRLTERRTAWPASFSPREQSSDTQDDTVEVWSKKTSHLGGGSGAAGAARGA